MAAPVFDSVTVTFPNGQTQLNPGQFADLVVLAHDPDARVIHVDLKLSDSAGTITEFVQDIPVADPLVCTGTVDSGTIAQTGPFTFRVGA